MDKFKEYNLKKNIILFQNTTIIKIHSTVTKSLNFISKHSAEITTTVKTGLQLHEDVKEHEGEDLKTAVGITAVAVGYGIAKGFNLLRDRWLNYLYIFEIHAVINLKKELYNLNLKEAV